MAKRIYKLDTVLAKIEDRQQALCSVDNNRQYIRVLNSLKFWLLELANNYADTAYYEQMFFTGAGHSFFTRICLSIEDYKYGNRPF